MNESDYCKNHKEYIYPELALPFLNKGNEYTKELKMAHNHTIINGRNV